MRTTKDHLILKWKAKHKINHLMPTTSPAPKFSTQIESVKGALDYYKSKGVTRVCLEPKYMGSYCDVYLYPNLKDTKFVSRGGNIIDYKERQELLGCITDLHGQMFDTHPDATLVLIGGELMPWSYLGKGLIDREYRSYLTGMQHMFSQDLSHNVDLSQYKRDVVILSKEELKAKYKSHEIRQYNALCELPDTVQMKEGIQTFNNQLNIFGKETLPEFKPFHILKIETESEVIVNGGVSFPILNDSNYQLLSVNDYLQAEHFFNHARLQGLEGIVVKPTLFKEGVARALKVRTPEYLHLIYGADFKYNFNKYYAKRKIKRKLGLHIKQADIANKLLHIRHTDISLDNKEYTELITKFLGLKVREDFLDNTL